jgi:DNA-binding transcriptional ArsR family regulator
MLHIRIHEYERRTVNKTLKEEIHRLHADLCQALSDPKRILILYELRNTERSVSDLSERLGIRQSNLSQHLSLLRERAMVSARRRGSNIYYSLTHPKIIEALDLLREVLADKLHRIGRLAGKISDGQAPKAKASRNGHA